MSVLPVKNIGILILDDVENILFTLKGLFELEDFDVTITTSPDEALKKLAERHYAVVISDQQMPEMKGTDFLKKARDISPDTARLLLTGYMDMDAAIQAINDGAVYKYIAKPWDDQELILLVNDALSQYYQSIENKKLQDFAKETYQKLGEVLASTTYPQASSPNLKKSFNLSQRETEILEYAAKGLSNKEIGEAIHLAQLTVKNHMANIYKKLDVSNRTQAVVLGQKYNLISD